MRWHWKALLCVNLIAVGLMLSWLMPETRAAFWDPLDYFVFQSTNATLTWHPAWRELWALANHRLFDVLAAGCFVLLFLRICKGASRTVVAEHWVSGVLLAVYAFFMLELTRYVMLDYDRASPTLVVDGAVRLSDWVTWLQFKDFSQASFPSDHAISAILFTVFIWKLGGWRYGIYSSMLAIVCTAPRIMSGAHWLSDALVGSAFFTLIGVSLLLATPAHKICHRCLYWSVSWLLGKGAALPSTLQRLRLRGVGELSRTYSREHYRNTNTGFTG